MSDYAKLVPERFRARSRSIGANEVVWRGPDIIEVLDALCDRGAVILGVESVAFPWAGSGPQVQVICDTSTSVKVRQAVSQTDKAWLSREKAVADIERNVRNPFGDDIWYCLTVKVTTPLEMSARAFTVAATAYKKWMERVATQDAPRIYLRELHGILGALQAAAADLPPVKLKGGQAEAISSSEETESNANLEEARAAWSLAATVASKLPFDAYSTVFDALDLKDRVAIVKDLNDDLGDIYLDLQRALALLETTPLNEAIWKWRFSYYTHWGRHCVHAQAAIYSYLACGRFFA
jgi:hypothetical protein